MPGQVKSPLLSVLKSEDETESLSIENLNHILNIQPEHEDSFIFYNQGDIHGNETVAITLPEVSGYCEGNSWSSCDYDTHCQLSLQEKEDQKNKISIASQSNHDSCEKQGPSSSLLIGFDKFNYSAHLPDMMMQSDTEKLSFNCPQRVKSKFQLVNSSSTDSSNYSHAILVGERDVVFGRGQGPANLIGNQAFRSFVTQYKSSYVSMKKHRYGELKYSKLMLAERIFNAWISISGRFVKKDIKRNNCAIVEATKEECLKKIKMFLRQKDTWERREVSNINAQFIAMEAHKLMM